MQTVKKELIDVINFYQVLGRTITHIVLGSESYFEMTKDNAVLIGDGVPRIYGFPVKIDREKAWRIDCEIA